AQMEGDYDRAVELYQSSLELHPTAEAHTFLGWTYHFQGRIEEAIAECRLAIEIDPEFGNPYNDIGAYLIELGRFEEAIPWLERATEARRYEPRHFPHYNLGRAYLGKEMYSNAMRCFQEALQIEPRSSLPGQRQSSRQLFSAWLEHAVINPQQQGRDQPHAGDHPPRTLRLVRHFRKLMHHAPPKPSSNKRANPNRQKRKAHVRPLLPGRRKTRNVFVIPRLLNDFAQRKDQDGEHRSGNSRAIRNDEPGHGRHQRSKNHRMKRRNSAQQVIYKKRESDDREAIGNQDDLHVGVRVDIALNVTRKRDILLPKNDPVARENEQKQHELWI